MKKRKYAVGSDRGTNWIKSHGASAFPDFSKTGQIRDGKKIPFAFRTNKWTLWHYSHISKWHSLEMLESPARSAWHASIKVAPDQKRSVLRLWNVDACFLLVCGTHLEKKEKMMSCAIWAANNTKYGNNNKQERTGVQTKSRMASNWLDYRHFRNVWENVRGSFSFLSTNLNKW